MKKLIQKILKCRTGITFIYGAPVRTEQWIAFGKFVIHQNFKTA